MSKVHSMPFAQIPEWVLDAEISDRAVRLFCVLHRHSNTEGRAFPGRKAMSARLVCSVDSIDRAMAELVQVGAVTVEKEHRPDKSQTVNSYYLWPCTGPAPQPQPCGPPAAQQRRPSRDVAAPLEEQESEPEEREPEESETPPTPAAEATESESPNLELIPWQNVTTLDLFEEFWNVYDKKTGGKIAAEKVWRQTVNRKGDRGASPAVLIEAARAYRAAHADKKFMKDPVRWLRQGCWLDEIEPPAPTLEEQREERNRVARELFAADQERRAALAAERDAQWSAS